MMKNIRKKQYWKYGLIIVISALSLISCEDGTPDFQNGDIIFHISKSSQSKAIQLATKSNYSHVGIIYREGAQYFVYEAVQPVKLTPLSSWIERGERKHYVLKRVRTAEDQLSRKMITSLKNAGKKYLNKNYDLYFEWSDERIYCSELVWKIFKEGLNIELGKLQYLETFDLTHPLVKAKLSERYGDTIPGRELVISPAAIFESNLLYTVYSN